MRTGADRTTRRFARHVPSGTANPTLRTAPRSSQSTAGPYAVQSRIFYGKEYVVVFVIEVDINVGI